MSVITVENVSKKYHVGSETVLALDKFSLKIQRGEIICILGPSGSGKTTLLNLLAGFEKPTEGRILIGNTNINRCGQLTLTQMRRKTLGFVFQNYNLLDYLTALENVSLPLMLQGVAKEERESRSAELLQQVGLATRLNHKPTQLSGGQQQRVSIARAFVNNPSIVFADEPTGNLDSETSAKILQMMVDIAQEHKSTLIMVSHDEMTTAYADRVIRLLDGKVTENGGTVIW